MNKLKGRPNIYYQKFKLPMVILGVRIPVQKTTLLPEGTMSFRLKLIHRFFNWI